VPQWWFKLVTTYMEHDKSYSSRWPECSHSSPYTHISKTLISLGFLCAFHSKKRHERVTWNSHKKLLPSFHSKTETRTIQALNIAKLLLLRRTQSILQKKISLKQTLTLGEENCVWQVLSATPSFSYVAQEIRRWHLHQIEHLNHVGFIPTQIRILKFKPYHATSRMTLNSHRF